MTKLVAELEIGWWFGDKTLESKGFNLSKTKTKYVECKFSDATHEVKVEVRFDA